MNAIDTAGRTPYQHLLDSVQAHDMHPNRCYGGGQFTPDSRTADERWLQDLVNVADSRRYEVFRARVRAALAYPGATDERWLQDLVNTHRSRQLAAFDELVTANVPRFAGSTVSVHYTCGVPCATVCYSDGSRRTIRVHPETGQPE